MSLEEELNKLNAGAALLSEGIKDHQSNIIKARRKSKELCEELDELAQDITNLAEASMVWQKLGGFKRNRRNSREFDADELRTTFNAIDKDSSGKINRDELRTAIMEQNATLKDEQLDALINFADVDGDGEIDFEEYKTIMNFQSGIPENKPSSRRSSKDAAPDIAGPVGGPA